MIQNVSIEIKNYGLLGNGYHFGSTGAYEILKGWSHFKIDPTLKANSQIVDIENAPTNQDGSISFSSEIYILRPTEIGQGNNKIFFDYGNRGNKRALQYFNDAIGSNDPNSIEHCGNGFLFRRGYTLV